MVSGSRHRCSCSKAASDEGTPDVSDGIGLAEAMLGGCNVEASKRCLIPRLLGESETSLGAEGLEPRSSMNNALLPLGW